MHGGWLSTDDGSTTAGGGSTADPSSSFAPQSQPTAVGPASNPASQPTPPPPFGVNINPLFPTTIGGIVPSHSLPNPVQQATNNQKPHDEGPTGTNLLSNHSKPLAGGGNVPTVATVTAVGVTSLAESLADHVTGSSNATPNPVVVISNGVTFFETPTLATNRPNMSPVPATIVSNGHTSIETPSPAPAVVTSDGKTFTEIPDGAPTPAVFTSDGKVFTQTTQASPTETLVVSNGETFTLTPIGPTTAQDANLVSGTPVVVISDGHTYTEAPYNPSGAASTAKESSIRPVATIVNSTGTFLLWPSGESTIYPQITLSQYVLVAFVPLILAILYTLPFRLLDRTIREFEPFYQLTGSGGALAEHSLCLDYSTSNILVTPFKSGLRGHGYMFWSSLLSVAVIAIAPLSSEALFVSLSGGPDLYGPDISVHYQDYASWGIYPVLVRLIEGLLAFVAVLIVLMIWYGMERESGVYGEPLSIAGLATLFHSSPLLRGFREIDSHVSNSDLKNMLAGQRYKIGKFVTAEYRPCYGLLPADSESGFIINAHRSKKGPYRLVDGTESAVDFVDYGSSNFSSERKNMSRLWDSVKDKLLYVCILILNTGILTLISYYHWSEGDIHHGFEKFMDSNGFGVRFMMTMLGVVLKMFWSNLDQGK